MLGPAEDGGYYLIALRAAALDPRLFAEIPWSTAGVLAATLERCRELGLAVELLPRAADVDTPADLRRLAAEMAAGDLGCPRTRGRSSPGIGSVKVPSPRGGSPLPRVEVSRMPASGSVAVANERVPL